MSMGKIRAAVLAGGGATADDYDAAHAELGPSPTTRPRSSRVRGWSKPGRAARSAARRRHQIGATGEPFTAQVPPGDDSTG